MHTFLRPGRRCFPGDVTLFEGPPFEVLPVATAIHISLLALHAGRLRFVTLQAFGFAGDAS